MTDKLDKVKPLVFLTIRILAPSRLASSGVLNRSAICAKVLHIIRELTTMPVYVDSEAIRWKGRDWCHLVADTFDELHDFAGRLGLQRRWFQDRGRYPHYDVSMPVRLRALRLGAIAADRATLIACCKRVRSQMLSGGAEALRP